MIRVNTVNTLIGGRGTGKSTFLMGDPDHNVKGLIPEYIKVKIPKILIVDTFDSHIWRQYPEIKKKDLCRWKKGVYRLFQSDTVELMDVIEKYVYNTVVFFEDATKFIDANITEKEKRFILDSKQKNVDLFFIFHSLMDVPKKLVRYQDNVILFKTNEILDNYLSAKYSHNTELKEAFERVKAHDNKFYNETINIGS
jgi:ABC-type sugar transport system ATPase subunit